MAYRISFISSIQKRIRSPQHARPESSPVLNACSPTCSCRSDFTRPSLNRKDRFDPGANCGARG
jgi:hypothetical protein